MEWPDATPPPAPKGKVEGVRIERFKPGIRRVIVLLGDPVDRFTHWDKELKKSVPCYDPRKEVPKDQQSCCPKCRNTDYDGTRRREAYAPVMVANDHLRRWEQAVAVFTKAGSDQLDQLDGVGERPWRGRRLAIKKEQQGNSTPMTVEELDAPHPDEFPNGLPESFSVRAVMLKAWFPHREAIEPIVIIAPIPYAKRSRRPLPTEREAIDIPTDYFLEEVRTYGNGMPNMARMLEAQRAEALKAEAAHETTPPPANPSPAPPPVKPAGVPQPSPNGKHPHPLPKPEAIDEQLNEIDQLANERTGETVCREVGDRLPQGHPAKRGKPVPAEQELGLLVDGISRKLGIKPSANGTPKGGAR